MLVPFAGAAIAQDGLAEGLGATVIYLVIYAVMNLGAFAVVIAGARRIGSYEISDWRGLGSYAPRLGVMLAVFFLSLAGLPPLAGWFAKFVMFRAVLISTGPAGVWLAVIAAVNAVVAFYYYARVVKSAWFDPAPDTIPQDTQTGPTSPLNLAMGVSLVVVLVVGAFPAIATFFGDAAAALVP